MKITKGQMPIIETHDPEWHYAAARIAEYRRANAARVITYARTDKTPVGMFLHVFEVEGEGTYEMYASAEFHVQFYGPTYDVGALMNRKSLSADHGLDSDMWQSRLDEWRRYKELDRKVGTLRYTEPTIQMTPLPDNTVRSLVDAVKKGLGGADSAYRKAHEEQERRANLAVSNAFRREFRSHEYLVMYVVEGVDPFGPFTWNQPVPLPGDIIKPGGMCKELHAFRVTHRVFDYTSAASVLAVEIHGERL